MEEYVLRVLEREIDNVVEWIRNFVKNAGADGVVVGLSGGVDSAVVAALAVKALGVDNVTALALPCESDPSDLEDAQLVADHLDLGLSVYDLEVPFNVFRVYLDVDKFQGIMPENNRLKNANGNLKARMRMTALYNEALLSNYLVIGTGNKSELAVGYITKWGDGGVDFEPLGDFYKTEVVEMARMLGLPERICSRTPTPGNVKGVTDEGELGMNYKDLDLELKRINNIRPECISGDRTKKVVDMIKNAYHKKKMPPFFDRRLG